IRCPDEVVADHHVETLIELPSHAYNLCARNVSVHSQVPFTFRAHIQLSFACSSNNYFFSGTNSYTCSRGLRNFAISFSLASISGSNLGISTALLPCSCLRKRKR